MYEKPRIIDHGSIVEHTFTRCNPEGATGTSIKDSIDVPHHLDTHQECSALS
jgi:hypothetical protein